jgi:DNA-binding NarL/FixJ family response regulator
VQVAIVEDDADIRQWLEESVQSCPGCELAGVYPSANAFAEDFDSLTADVVIMDINMPGMSGIQCIETLKPRRPEVQYMMCTIIEDADSIFEALCAGATGYLLKNTSQEKICEAVIEIYNGGSPMSSQIARKVVGSFNQKPRPSSELEKLSAREREILDYLAKGYRYKEIADKLFISTETIRTHIRNIYEKLHVQSRMEAVNKAYPRG